MATEQSGEWWARISHAFESHVREESFFLEAYEELCAGVEDPGTRFLVELILDDERRHHELFKWMAEDARGNVDATPPPPSVSPREAGPLLERTEEFLTAEREDRGHLKDLAKQLAPLEGDTLWRLLIELMDLDTQKHVRILEYLRNRLRDAT